MLSAVPFGATNQDLGEFMIGTVLVTPVLMESNGTLDPSTENWTGDEINWQKHRFLEAAKWWETAFANQGSLHSLKFEFDWTYLEKPFSTKYEPISRSGLENILWVDEFLAAKGYPTEAGPSNTIFKFNHDQRLKYNTNWAFTAFVADASSAPGGQFAPGGHRNAFAYPGGRYMVLHSMRPEMTIAHEMAHIFWAMDEYSGGSTYTAHRGYYDTQNTNASTGHPDRIQREMSIMDDMNISWNHHAVSTSARETMGWRDSDMDGIFDVMDVPLELTGQGTQDPVTKAFSFAGKAKVGVLENRNPMSWQNDITLNRVGRIEYRFDSAPEWKTAVVVDKYEAVVDVRVDVPAGAEWIELRAAEATLPLYSEVIRQPVVSETVSPWWNRREPLDVNDDQQITPLDALLVVNYLNLNGAGVPVAGETAPPFIDCNGDRVIAPIDALMVINRLNRDVASRVTPVTPVTALPVEPAIPAQPAVATAAEPDGLVRIAVSDVLPEAAWFSSRSTATRASGPREPFGPSPRTAADEPVGIAAGVTRAESPRVDAVFADRLWCDSQMFAAESAEDWAGEVQSEPWEALLPVARDLGP